jgi:hypothetical protein
MFGSEVCFSDGHDDREGFKCKIFLQMAGPAANDICPPAAAEGSRESVIKERNLSNQRFTHLLHALTMHDLIHQKKNRLGTKFCAAVFLYIVRTSNQYHYEKNKADTPASSYFSSFGKRM